MRRIRALGLLLGAAVLATTVIACGPSSMINADQAVTIARDFATARQASNEDIREVTAKTPTKVDQRWRVPVDLLVVYGPLSGALPNPSDPPIWIHYLIDVDRTTGQPSIVAQG